MKMIPDKTGRLRMRPFWEVANWSECARRPSLACFASATVSTAFRSQPRL